MPPASRDPPVLRVSTTPPEPSILLEAVALAPDDVAIRLSLARYYQSTGKPSRAMAEIETVMSLDAGNENARRMLDRRKQPTRMQKLVQRIFR